MCDPTISCFSEIQQNRDPISSTIQGTSDGKSEKDIEEARDAPMLEGPLYDFQSLMEELREIFVNVRLAFVIICHTFNLQVELEDNSENYSSLSSLGKMEWGLRWLRRGQKRRYLEVSLSFEILLTTHYPDF